MKQNTTTRGTLTIAKTIREAIKLGASAFYSKYESRIDIDSADNILDMDEGFVNLQFSADDGDVYLLFIDGAYDTYSF